MKERFLVCKAKTFQLKLNGESSGALDGYPVVQERMEGIGRGWFGLGGLGGLGSGEESRPGRALVAHLASSNSGFVDMGDLGIEFRPDWRSDGN